MPEPEKQKVTEDQANEALRSLLTQQDEEPEGTVTAETVPDPEPEPEEPLPPSGEPRPIEEPKPEEPSDDVASLKARLAEREAAEAKAKQDYDERVKAVQQRSAENERILRERYLRKATVTDRALKALRAVRSTGISEDDADAVIREIESTMNPSSPSYVPPAPAAAVEDQAIVMNAFLNEKGMTVPEAQAFGRWIQTEGPNVLSPTDLAVAQQSLDGFLRIAHSAMERDAKVKEVQRNQTVEAVKSVQRTQREAAKAASSVPSSPKKQPAGTETKLDLMKMPKKDQQDAVAQLLRMSVEQYR